MSLKQTVILHFCTMLKFGKMSYIVEQFNKNVKKYNIVQADNLFYQNIDLVKIFLNFYVTLSERKKYSSAYF